jgi:DNA-binding CsgD family transcriptional regulator
LARLAVALGSAHLAALQRAAATRSGALPDVAQAVALARDVGRDVLGEAELETIWAATGAPRPEPVSPAMAPVALGVAEPRHVAPAFGLTPREEEILGLLSQRLTDQEIAARLFLSPKTVGHHVSNILGKLGAANRRDAAARAVRHSLI